MLHLVCLHPHLGSRGSQLRHHELLLPLLVLRMGYASSVVVQDTVLENAGRIRINLHCLPTSPTTTMPDLTMVVFRLTTLRCLKLKTSLLL